MRASAYFSTVFSLVGLVLSLLCLFAGSKPGFIEDAEIMTIDLSQVAQEILSNSTQSNSNNVQSTASSLTSQLGIHDWYSMHVMNYCEGDYDRSSNTMNESCSAAVPFFAFNPIQIIDSEFKDGVNMSVLGLHAHLDVSASGWPTQITNVASKAQTAYKVMFFMLCMGIAASGVETIVSFVVMLVDQRTFSHGSMVSLVNFVLAAIAFFGLGVASAIITSTMVNVVKTINSQGLQIGLTAAMGTKFLWMTWSATVLVFLAMLMWVMDYFKERSIYLSPYGDNYHEPLLDYRNVHNVQKEELHALKAEEKHKRKMEAAELSAVKHGAVAPVAPSRSFLRPAVGMVLRNGASHVISNQITGGSSYNLSQEPSYGNHQHMNMKQGFF